MSGDHGYWEEEAKRYSQNSDYWRTRAEVAESELGVWKFRAREAESRCKKKIAALERVRAITVTELLIEYEDNSCNMQAIHRLLTERMEGK